MLRANFLQITQLDTKRARGFEECLLRTTTTLTPPLELALGYGSPLGPVAEAFPSTKEKNAWN